ncbi:hypothetical protein LO763_02110 [Glycomyces sp. A-F 0318]|uniref:hypothetical protein n=1 Tax=Glycomyces amatae TaxID=2881355 RepID=UPI001E2C1084|nr:hypothetical protein [Glycomyces amatae]MCD0442418.1 hypothetical protein [Glycomyces amatae]
MTSQKDSPDQGAQPAFESDALRLSDIAGRDAAEVRGVDDREPPGLVEDEQEIAARDNIRGIVLAVAAVGVAAAVVVGLKIAYDRRKASHRYRRMVAGHFHDAKDSVAGHLGDARDSIVSVASELPGRGRDVLHQLKHH